LSDNTFVKVAARSESVLLSAAIEHEIQRYQKQGDSHLGDALKDHQEQLFSYMTGISRYLPDEGDL
jgi:hypothetical protein